MSDGERALAGEVFGRALDAARVRLLALPLWPRAFVPGGRLMVWPAGLALSDFSGGDVPLGLQAIFVHELVHVWQAQRGVNLLAAKLRAGDGAAAYAYDLDGAQAFERLNIEQQAMVVQHAFVARRGGRTPFQASLYEPLWGHWGGG